MASVMLLLQDLKLQCSMGMHRRAEAASIIEEAYREGKGVDGSPLEAIAWHAVAERDMYTLRKYITVLYEERRIRELVQWLDLTSRLAQQGEGCVAGSAPI